MAAREDLGVSGVTGSDEPAEAGQGEPGKCWYEVEIHGWATVPAVRLGTNVLAADEHVTEQLLSSPLGGLVAGRHCRKSGCRCGMLGLGWWYVGFCGFGDPCGRVRA